MEPQSLADLAVSLEDAIVEVIPLGGHWEIWLQTELARKLQAAGTPIRLEVSYEAGQNLKRMDLVLGLATRTITVELKVESSVVPGYFAGAPYNDAVGGDILKSRDFVDALGLLQDEHRWVLAVAYSQTAVSWMEELHIDTPPSGFARGPRLQADSAGPTPGVVGVAAAVYVSYYY